MFENIVEETTTSTKNYYLYGSILSFLLSIFFYYYLNINFTIALEKGPKFVFLLLILSFIFLIIFLILLLIWIYKKYNKEIFKKFFYGLIILIFLILIIYIINNKLKKKNYKKIIINGIERQYIIYKPKSFNLTFENNSLLLGLHGGMGNAKQYQDSSYFNLVSEKYKFLMVYPDGLGFFKFTSHVWNSGTIQAGIEQNSDDVLFLSLLIQKLISEYNINPNFVYITGHSNSAMMTYRMAGERSDLIKGAAPTAGSIGGYPTKNSSFYIIPTPNKTVNIVHVHGLLDINAPYNGGYAKSGFYVDERFDLSVNQSISFWIKANQCSNISIIENSINNKITLNSYFNGINSSFVKLVTFNQQNHFWDNLDKEQKNEKFKNFDSLSELIWILLTNE